MQQEKASIKGPLIRIGIAILLLALTFGFLFYYQSRDHVRQRLYDIRVIEPNCTDSGYSLYTLKSSGETFTRDIVAPLGHSFNDWILDREAGVNQLGIQSHQCSRCGYVEEVTLYPESELPIVSLEGDLEGIGKITERSVSARFLGADRSFDSYATVKYQGHSAIGYEKKNYTLKLYEDEARTDKMKLTFSHWNKEHKYILKANYMDPTGCRNLAAAKIWASVVESRSSRPREFEQLSNFGAVDGFPVALYINREFQGLYTWNLHKDEDLFNMEDGEQQAVMVVNTDNVPEAFFREPAAFEESTPWEVEFCGTEDAHWAKEKLNALVAFVNDSDDAAFQTQLIDHLDVDSAIDYLLSVYALGLTEHKAANLLLVTYGENEPWTASLYDLGTAFGLSADGQRLVPPEEFLPTQKEGTWASNTGNLLWDRLLKLYMPQLKSRYAQLRQTVLTPETVEQSFAEFYDPVPEDLRLANAQMYPAKCEGSDDPEQITTYITQRLTLLDAIFLEEGS